MTAVARRFMKLHPDVQIEVHTGGSGRGIEDARRGVADLGMASRALNGNERDLFGFPVARDGVCLIVHKENPVPALSDELVGDIFRGRVTNWKEAGGPDAPIIVVNRSPGRGEVEVISDFYRLPYADIRAAAVAGDNQEGIRRVANDRHAITYMSLGESERCQRAGVAVKPLPVHGVPATSQQVRAGNFPVARPLTLVGRGLPTGLAKHFLDFALSSEVTDLIEQYNFVPYLD
jgi:phosphate transport system substrate-binding protein